MEMHIYSMEVILGSFFLMWALPFLLCVLIGGMKQQGCASIMLGALFSWFGLLIVLILPNNAETKRRHRETLDQMEQQHRHQMEMMMATSSFPSYQPPNHQSPLIDVTDAQDYYPLAESVPVKPKVSLTERWRKLVELARATRDGIRSTWESLPRRKQREMKATALILAIITAAAAPVFWYLTQARH